MIPFDKKKNQGAAILSRMDASGREVQAEARNESDVSAKEVLAGKLREAIQSGSDQDLVDALDAYLAQG